MRNTYLSFNKAKFNHLFNSLRNSILLLSVGITLSGCIDNNKINETIENYFNSKETQNNIKMIISHIEKTASMFIADNFFIILLLILCIGFVLTLGHLLGLQFVEGTKITWDYIKSSLSEDDDNEEK